MIDHARVYLELAGRCTDAGIDHRQYVHRMEVIPANVTDV